MSGASTNQPHPRRVHLSHHPKTSFVECRRDLHLRSTVPTGPRSWAAQNPPSHPYASLYFSKKEYTVGCRFGPKTGPPHVHPTVPPVRFLGVRLHQQAHCLRSWAPIVAESLVRRPMGWFYLILPHVDGFGSGLRVSLLHFTHQVPSSLHHQPRVVRRRRTSSFAGTKDLTSGLI